MILGDARPVWPGHNHNDNNNHNDGDNDHNDNDFLTWVSAFSAHGSINVSCALMSSENGKQVFVKISLFLSLN